MEASRDEVNNAIDLISRAYFNYPIHLEYKKPTKIDNNTFYRIVSGQLRNGDTSHPKSARKAICQFQENHEITYCLFEPDEFNETDPRKCLKSAISKSRKNQGDTTRRDIHAAANVLGKTIILFIKDGNGIHRDTFFPDMTESTENLCLLKITPGPFFELTTTVCMEQEHANCLWTKYRKHYVEFLDFPVSNTTILNEGDCIPNAWKIVHASSGNKSFFDVMSMAIYGTVKFAFNIMELMLLQVKDQNDGFYTMLLDDLEKNIKQKLEEHCDKIRKGDIPPTEVDIYAMAAILQTDIYIASKSESSHSEVNWSRFFTFSTLSRSESKRSKSYLVLFVQKGSDERPEYGWLMPNERSNQLQNPLSLCTCTERPPKLTGCLSTVLAELPHLAETLLSRKESCCPSNGRHGLHTHLHGMAVIQESGERTNRTNLSGRKVADDILSFDQCIHGEEQEETANEPTAADIQTKADTLGVPIYIYNPAQTSWKAFSPAEPNTECRYYITLCQNEDGRTFSLVFPEEGCNCQYIPPSIPTDLSGIDLGNITISMMDHHSPMIEFLEDREYGERTDVNLQIVTEFEGSEEVFTMSSMKERDIEECLPIASETNAVEGDYFFNCLSKEILGNEDLSENIREYICEELRSFSNYYRDFLHGMKQEKFRQFIDVTTKGIERNFRVEDVHITAAATFFQTDIYILKIDKKGPAWKGYFPVRRKQRPKKMPKRISKCRRMNQQGDYYVTLFLDLAWKFHRIVPHTKSCNCEVPKPDMQCYLMENRHIPVLREARMIQYHLTSTSHRLKDTLTTWMYLADEIMKIGEEAKEKLKEHRKNTNIATIVGTGIGTIGGILITIGVVTAPLTFGVTSPLIGVGGLATGIGGTTATGSRIAEAIIGKNVIIEYEELSMLLELSSQLLKEDIGELKKAMEDARSFVTDISPSCMAQNDDNMALSAAPGVFRIFTGLHVIPAAALRTSLTLTSTIVSSVFGAAGIVLDIVILGHAIYNTVTGNKTSTTERIEKMLKALEYTKCHLNDWAYGSGE